MSLAESHPQLTLARVALLGRTYSIGITRTTCDRIGPVHLLNRASSEKQHCGPVVAVRVIAADRQIGARLRTLSSEFGRRADFGRTRCVHDIVLTKASKSQSTSAEIA